MNQISCVFLSDDLFIINILDDYKALSDKKLGYIISTCIGFNSHIEGMKKKYLLQENFPIFMLLRGIIIVKNFDNFSSEYIVVSVKKANTLIKDMKKCTINNKMDNKMNNKMSTDFDNEGEEDEFIDFLTPILKELIFEKNICDNVDCFNSLFNGEIYTYSINKNTKIDFDILIHNYLTLVGKKMIDNIEFRI